MVEGGMEGGTEGKGRNRGGRGEEVRGGREGSRKIRGKRGFREGSREWGVPGVRRTVRVECEEWRECGGK